MEMNNYALFTVKLFSALGCGLVAGIFFAFSTFVQHTLLLVDLGAFVSSFTTPMLFLHRLDQLHRCYAYVSQSPENIFSLTHCCKHSL
jgi:hypothetical protein